MAFLGRYKKEIFQLSIAWSRCPRPAAYGPDGDLGLGVAIGCFRTCKTFGILGATEST